MSSARQRKNASPVLVALLYQLYQQTTQLPVKPPVTLFLIATMIYIHFSPLYAPDLDMIHRSLSHYVEIGDIRENCLAPEKVVRLFTFTGSLSMNRIIYSAFIHADDIHLYYNMLSFLWKGANLEVGMGSIEFSGLLLYSLLSSHVIMILLSYLLHEQGLGAYSGYQTCAVGFSAVLFALK
jgi:rhomboid domain-containing protein 1